MGSTTIIEKNVVDQYVEDMVKYAMFVNRRRMVPDYKDGMKTVHRRIIYAMVGLRTFSSNSKVKSARIVGDTIGKYHPHGDTSVYDAMKILVNWFDKKIPLIQGSGSWGTIQGDSQAAMRYTEAYLKKYTIELIDEMTECKNVVDWLPTFDNSNLEPEVLPMKIPLLLINGDFGIGYGIQVNIPPHNPGEVIDATLALLDNPDAQICLIPDPTQACEIIETNFKAISNKGNGKVVIRGIIDIEKDGRRLVIKSTPDRVTLNTIKSNIQDLIVAKKLPQISDMRDETVDEKNTTILRFEIDLKKGSDPNYVRDVIYKNTSMQKTETINFEVLDGVDIQRLSYKSYLLAFIEFRKLCLFRVYANRFQTVETKLHEKDAFIKAIQSGKINEIIEIIQKNKKIDDNADVERLIKMLHITDLQAKYILNASIKKLSIGYLNKYLKEAEELNIIRNECLQKMTNTDLLVEDIRRDLIEFKEKYNQPRKSRVISIADVNNIPQGEFKIIITQNNFIKKVQLNDNINNYKGDTPKLILKGDNTKDILIFDEQGKVFKLPIHKIPFVDKGSNGIDIRLLIKNLTSNINTIIYAPLLEEYSKRIDSKYYLTVLTKNGSIKKLDLNDFLTTPPSGILYIKLDDKDFVTNVSIVKESSDILVYSRNKALRMNLNDVPHQRRNTKGVKAMNVNEVDGMSIISSNASEIIVITEKGKINRFSSLALPLSTRNKAGSSVIKLDKSDYIKAILTVLPGDYVRIITKNESVDILVDDIKVGSSISAGTKMINTGNDTIIKCNVIRTAK